jgi:hypothetical protein
MKVVHYRIESMSRDAESCILWALAEWERELKGRVKFIRNLAGAQWQFQFSEQPEWPVKIAKCLHVTDTDKTITFDPRQKWAVTKWQRIFGSGSDMRKLALHEIGHALGLRHNGNVNSIMHPTPANARIDAYSLQLLS